MYEFHCDYINSIYCNILRLIFTDTDSLMFQSKTEGVYEDFISKDGKMFDFSNFPADSKYYDDSNKLLAIKIKDQTGDSGTTEFAGLKSKMYSFLVDYNSEHKESRVINNLQSNQDNFFCQVKRVLLPFSLEQLFSFILLIKCFAVNSNNKYRGKKKNVKVVPYHLRTKNMCKPAVKKLPFLIKYFSDKYKTPLLIIILVH